MLYLYQLRLPRRLSCRVPSIVFCRLALTYNSPQENVWSRARLDFGTWHHRQRYSDRFFYIFRFIRHHAGHGRYIAEIWLEKKMVVDGICLPFDFWSNRFFQYSPWVRVNSLDVHCAPCLNATLICLGFVRIFASLIIFWVRWNVTSFCQGLQY